MKLKEIFELEQKELKEQLQTFLEKSYNEVSSEKGFLYAKGNIPIMFVAHLDTVHKSPPIVCMSEDSRYMMSPTGIGGDDRCGVHIILQLLDYCKNKNQMPYILFCEDEEIGTLGAKQFIKTEITPNINFIVEYDRKGSIDAVFYQNDNEEFENFICDFGFEKAIGSYSDISVIAPHLGVSAVNLSSGYYSPHSNSEYVDLLVVNKVIEKSKKIIDNCFEKKYIYVQKTYTSTYTSSSYSNYNSGFFGSNWYNKEKEKEKEKETQISLFKGEETSLKDKIMLNRLYINYWVLLENGKDIEIKEDNTYFIDQKKTIYLKFKNEESYMLIGKGDVLNDKGVFFKFKAKKGFFIKSNQVVYSLDKKDKTNDKANDKAIKKYTEEDIPLQVIDLNCFIEMGDTGEIFLSNSIREDNHEIWYRDNMDNLFSKEISSNKYTYEGYGTVYNEIYEPIIFDMSFQIPLEWIENKDTYIEDNSYSEEEIEEEKEKISEYQDYICDNNCSSCKHKICKYFS